jgi:hypothetical protein
MNKEQDKTQLNIGGVMLSLPLNEIEAILLDCRNMLMQCESTTIGQTQIKLKIIQIENLYRKLKLGNGAQLPTKTDKLILYNK